MPEIYKDFDEFHLLDSQNYYHFRHDATMSRMNSPDDSSNDSPSAGSMPSPLSPVDSLRGDDFPLNFNESSFMTLSDTTGLEAVELGNPEIVILDQPVEKFRFRYKSEMMGTHGSLASINATTRRKRHAPTVQLKHFPGTAIIRCTLVTKNEDRRIPHAHHLVKREGNTENDRPYEIQVSAENDWMATFHGMGIIHTAKKHIKDELIKKMKREQLEKNRRENPQIKSLSFREEAQIKMDAESAQKWMDLNSVALCFQAFVPNKHGVLCPLTVPVYSHTINNLKSALTGELKICRIDKYVSSCAGGDEVFLLVEKVGKKNIKIKFFETDDKDNEIWTAYGRFSELDVHHQYAIVFRTPPYKDQEITSPREVFIQLERPTDGDCSEPMKFTYKPMDNLHRKRPRMSYSENIELDKPIPPDTTMSRNTFTTIAAAPALTSRDLSEEFRKLANEKIPSGDFQIFIENMPDVSEYLELATQGDPEYEMDLCFDGVTDNIREGPHFAMNVLKEALEQAKGDTIKIQKHLKVMLKERTTYGDTPLHSALRHGQRDIVKYILYIIGSSSQFASIIDMQNASCQTPLHYAVILNQPDIVRALLILGANPNSCDNRGSYVLHEAIKRPDAWQCVDALLEAKASFEIRDDNGWLALQLAAEAGSLKAIDSLIKAGADVNSMESSFGRTALHVAVEGGHIDIVRYLLEKTDINVNAQNMGGNTALHAAVVNSGSRAKDLCQLLTKHGADPYIPNGHSLHHDEELTTIKKEFPDEDDIDGQTSFDLASGNDEIQNLFLEVDKDRRLEPTVLCEIKEEAKDEQDDTMTEWLDVDLIAKLAAILEKNRGWQPLAKCLGCDYLSSSLEKSGASPALTILSYAEVKGNLTVTKLLNMLHQLKQTEAATFLEDIIKNQTRSH